MSKGKDFFNYPSFSELNKILKESNGKNSGILGVTFDFALIKEVEQRLLDAKIKESVQEERVNSMKAIAASIAHELRTPLTSISMAVQCLKQYIPQLLSAYRLARENGLVVGKIRTTQYQLLDEMLQSIHKETQVAHTVINMLLMNLREKGINKETFERLSIKSCIHEALERYPFESREKFRLIHYEEKNDFYFLGDRLYFIHVLFNLIKNALYYIEKAGKGEITITLSSIENHNILKFIDTGTGISEDILPKIFNQFFTSKEKEGTGVGLSFCKTVMQGFGGDIVCESKEGEFTEFRLIFSPI